MYFCSSPRAIIRTLTWKLTVNAKQNLNTCSLSDQCTMPSMPSTSLLRAVIVLNLWLTIYFAQVICAQLDTRLCYYIYNYVQPDARPCYPPSAKAISHCCGIKSTCLGDTLCLSSDGPMYIGSCTVKDWWNSTTIPNDCPKYYEYCKGKLKEAFFDV